VQRKRAIVVGSGIGGIACAIRLQSLGFDTTVLERMEVPGGRACVHKAQGFTFDMGPTVLTVPHFIEELFSLERDKAGLAQADFPEEILDESRRITSGVSGGPNTSRYLTIVPIMPFYRIFFDDGSWFDYDCDPDNTRAQIAKLAPEDVEGYDRFHAAAKAIFDRGFIELGYTYFGSIKSMLSVTPDLIRLDAVRSLFSFISKYFKSDKMRQVFSFETLLIGGNPQKVPAIYAMIHFVEKTWGVHFAKGGTGALVDALLTKLYELGGELRCGSAVASIDVEKRKGKRIATGVTLETGETLQADLVVSNADYANTYLKLVDKQHRRFNRDSVVKFRRQSMSLVVVYFGFVAIESDKQLQHHNIILGPRYEELLNDIFERKILAEDFSQYLHIPTLTDPDLAPEGHHAAYTLIPVPNNLSNLDWDELGKPFADKVLKFLDTKGYLEGLLDRLVYTNYLVGQGTQPGGGTPSVMMSAKMTAREVARDFDLPDSITA